MGLKRDHPTTNLGDLPLAHGVVVRVGFARERATAGALHGVDRACGLDRALEAEGRGLAPGPGALADAVTLWLAPFDHGRACAHAVGRDAALRAGGTARAAALAEARLAAQRVLWEAQRCEVGVSGVWCEWQRWYVGAMLE